MGVRKWIMPGRYTLPDGGELYDVEQWALGMDPKMCCLCKEEVITDKILVYPMDQIRAMRDDTNIDMDSPHTVHAFIVCEECGDKVPEDKDEGTSKMLSLLCALDESTLPKFNVDPREKLVFHTKIQPATLKKAFADLPIKVNKTCFEVVEPGHLYYKSPGDTHHISFFPEQEKIFVVHHMAGSDEVTYFGWPEWDDIHRIISFLRTSEDSVVTKWVHELVWSRINRENKERTANQIKKVLEESGITPDKLMSMAATIHARGCDCHSEEKSD